MNEQIKELAVQAGLDAKEIRDDESLTLYAFEDFDLERFAEIVRQDEREMCAKLCEDLNTTETAYPDWDDGTYDCAKAIRARGDKHETSPNTRDKRAATELRRLHQVNQELRESVKKANAQAEHFERLWYLRGDVNEELVEALKEIAEWTERYTSVGHPISTVARAILAKHKEQ